MLHGWGKDRRERGAGIFIDKAVALTFGGGLFGCKKSPPFTLSQSGGELMRGFECKKVKLVAAEGRLRIEKGGGAADTGLSIAKAQRA